jgi:hypothetical protein
MKRTRRVSIEIEHREISISFTLIEPRADSQTHLIPDSGPIPVACAVCGAPWVFVSPKKADGSPRSESPRNSQGCQASPASPGSHLEQVSSVFLQLGLHPPIFAGGMFLICRQSFDQLREKL